jgi:hypothetical protein
MISSVISRPIGAIVKFSVIVKICKYKRLHEGHHFILIAMEEHGGHECDMGRFIRECAHLFHDRRSKDNLSLFFCIQFFSIVLVLLFNML